MGRTPWLSIWAGVYAGLRNDAPWAAESYDQLMSANGRLCCKSLKTPGDKFPARSRNKPRSLIDVASGSLPKSPVNLSPGDEVPHMFTAKAASTARKICDQRCKKTFTTQSAQSGRKAI